MRINTPVTDREVVVGAEDLIVSRTDLQGRIVFVNWTFINISGFSEEELIGKSHNIVRHPDMPPEAFADLWKTLQSGRPWSGMVKNRCKSGDYYWVRADASPIMEDGVITGYLSVRTKPSRSEIEAAAALYGSLRDGSAKGIALSAGRPIGTGWLARLARLTTESSFKGRLVALVGLLSLLIGGVGFLGINGQSSTGEELRKVYQDRTIPLTQIADIRRRLLQNRLSIAVSLVTPDAETIRSNTAIIEQNIDEISRLWDSFSARSMGASEKTLADQFVQDRGRFVKEGLKPAVDALRKGDVTEAERIVVDKIRPLYVPVDSGIDALTKLQVELAKREYEQSHQNFIAMRNLSIASILIGVAIAIVFGLLMIRSLVNALLRAESIAQSVARGDLTVAVGFSPRDETGSLIDALRIMMQTLKGVEAAQAEMLKLHAAGQLDYKIGAQQFQGSYRKMADQVNELASSYIFLNNHIVDVVQRYSAGDLSSDLERLPGQKARITAAIDGVKASLSAINTQIDQLVGAAARGDFTARGDAEKFQHDFRKMIEGLNRLMQTSDVGLQEVARVMRGLARGDLTERIDNEYEGTFGQLKDDANTTVEKLNGMMGQIKLAAEAMKAASSEIASGNGDLSQRTEEQATSLEETAASLEQLTAAVRQNADNSQQANQLAKGATEVAQKGGEVVGEVVQTMAMINESSRRIADIIGVIDGIAFQTNILALNAAVEAARAGEQGRGFAVVATEVRSLAQRSATAAKEIKDLIGDSVEKVDAGTRLVGDAGRTMEDVVQSIRRVSTLIGEINAASQEQSTGIEQVNAAVTQMDEVTQQNAALVEQVAASAESMEEQAKALNTSVGAFLLANEAGPQSGATKRGPSLTKQRAKQAA